MLDVGTNSELLLSDPLYLGYPSHRLGGEAYVELVDELMAAIRNKFPLAVVQFEDFLTPNAYRFLDRYRSKYLMFNADIQGTAAVALAGTYAATRLAGVEFSELRAVFLGAGSAATGIGDLFVSTLRDVGLEEMDAYRRLWYVDIKGLVVTSRGDLQPHNLPYAHDQQPCDLMTAIKTIKPHVLIGATGAGGSFTQEIIEQMAAINHKSIIFALSNPTSQAECTAEQAYTWSNGRATFASGSPFPAYQHSGSRHVPGQGNNAYVFPGIGLRVLACEATRFTDEMFLVAAKALADQVSDLDMANGTIYPGLASIRSVSLRIAVAVAEVAYAQNIAAAKKPADLEQHIEALMYTASYQAAELATQ